jgi:DnaK suppressor protein
VNAKSGKDSKSKAVTAKAKAVAKPAAKPAKAAAKVTVKPAAKAAAPVKAKVVPKPVKAPAKVAEKVSPKPVAKAPAKTAKAAAPAPVKAVAKPAAKPAAPVKAVPAPKPVAVAPAPAPAPVALAPVVQKAGRPSSRLAQLTVPSMAQSVASTAAKASYSQSLPSPVIVPVLPSSIKKDPKLANNWKSKPVAELTDADLMAMPDSEYMNEVQLAAFRLKLVSLKRDILNSAGETTEHLREDTSVVPDPADRATIEEEHALELRTRDRERKLLKKIEQSIARIDAGDYGYCDETGEPIGVGRLLARPTATLSLEAQQRRELKQKMFGD